MEANTTPNCIGIIAWMHTFSPAKMWIGGLKILHKPLLHLHTQFNRDIPWSNIDMDFMNLNQSAHGDREFGFIMSRMRLIVKWSSVTGRMPTFSNSSTSGCALPLAGTTGRAQNSAALAITCARWPLPMATKSKQK